MKRLMFSVVGVTAIAAISGCGTANGPFKGDSGRPLTTATGAAIVVVDSPASSSKKEISKDATMRERVKIQAENAKQPVQISKADAEQAQNLAKEVKGTIADALVAMSENLEHLKKIVVFVDGRPQVTKDALEKVSKRTLSNGTIVALRAILEEQLDNTLKTKVYPKLVDATLKKIEPIVDQAVASGAYATARNVIWSASTCGIAEVDKAVREKAIELMHYKVNPSNWRVVESSLTAAFNKAMDQKAYDKGIEELRALEKKSIQQEYASLLDKKIAAIKKELIALGISEKDMQPILEKQGALISETEKILDVMDDVMTLEKAKKETREIAPRQDPTLKAYYEKLDEFRSTLVKYNCNEDKAEQLVVNLDEDLLALINLLRKPAQFEEVESGEKTALQLGTRSLNKRIHDTANDYVAKLEAAKAAAHLAEIRVKLEAAKNDLIKKVKALVAEGKYEEARELIWNASITGDKEWDADFFVLGISLLRDIVNPADWARIEAEITAKFTELSEEGKYDELTAYLQSYPLIRQHTVKLDEQLARVRAEAEALGADPEQAAQAALTACGMVTEAKDLVDHFDQIVTDAVVAGTPVDKSKLQAELEAYAKKLSAYHATPENVAKIVEQLRVALEKLIVAAESKTNSHLALGTNAVNDRIRALTGKLLASIEATKHDWENRTCEKLSTDLEERVRAAVREQRFDEARDMIRDEKLIGREDLDLQLYALRVGLLDSCVNPAQLDYLLAEIEKRVKAFVEAEDYVGFKAYVENYPYVHDTYASIDSALAAVKKEMLALEISQDESEKDEKVRFAMAIRELLEKRRESWKPTRDLKPLEEALSNVAKAIFDHMNKHPDAIEAERQGEYDHILADLAALDRTITTWELNERLRQRLEMEKPAIEAGLAMLEAKAARKAYLDELAKIDSEVSFDAQIAMAEEAISRQLGQKCPRASYQINAVLGEYARAFRLLKKGAELSTAEATSVLLGAAYLEQAAVLPAAIKLGANVNGVSARDPLKRTALMLSIDAQNLSMMKALVEAGAEAKATDAKGNAVLHYAVKSGSVTAIRALAKAAPLTVANEAGETPLFEAVKRNQAVLAQIVLDLVAEKDRKSFVNAKAKDGLTAFALAAKLGSRDVLDPLASAGAEYSEAELILAEEGDHLAIAQWLVAQGADVNAEGVMAKACPSTATGRYLRGEGGVGDHACEACQPCCVKDAKVEPVKPEKKVAASGTITFAVESEEPAK